MWLKFYKINCKILKMNAAAPSNYPMATLYVGDLAPDVNEAVLFDKFSATGPVVSIRVCRDLATRRSLGYAYVNFQQSADAERALDTMNFQPINGRPCRIMWCQRDPSLRRSGVGNIFIKNLDKSIDNKALYDMFSAFGNVLSCQIALDENEVSKGFGYVHFETQEAADQAIEKVNGMLLNDKKVYVGKWMSRKERLEQLGDQPRKFTNVYVKNLSEDTSEDELRKMFEEFGEIQSLEIMRHEDGQSKCFGFVSYADPESASKAVEDINEKEVNSRTLYCGPSQKKAERQAELRRRFQQQKMERINQFQGVNLSIKNLEESIDDNRLRKEFESYGTITSAKVMRDDKGNSKGFGFVCFQSSEEAIKAVTEKNGQILLTKPLYVALAQTKQERQAQLAAQHMQRVAGRMIPQGTQPVGQMFTGGFYPMTAFQAGQRPPMFPPQVVRTRFPTQTVRGQPAYPPMMNRARMQRTSARPMGHNQQQSRVAGGSALPGMGPQRVNPVQGGGSRNKYRSPVNQQPGPPATANTSNSPSIPIPGQDILNPTTLAQASASDQKQMLGERLFPLIQRTHPGLAGKITGMLLETDNSELLHMLEFPDALAAKVEEAVSVLRAHQAREAKQEHKGQCQTNFLPQKVVRTRFPSQPARGQPGYPQMKNCARMQRTSARPMAYNQQQSRVAGGSSMPGMGPQRVNTVQGDASRNKYRSPVNQQPGPPATANTNNSSSISIPNQDILNPTTLAQASTSDQKQMLGERLFPLIQQTHPELAGKITGMLLEIDNSELLHMLEFPDALAAKVEEAVSVLRAHQARETNQELKG